MFYIFIHLNYLFINLYFGDNHEKGGEDFHHPKSIFYLHSI